MIKHIHLSITVAITLLAVTASHCQKGFIEVMVKDTIRLRPVSYEFQVSSGLNFEYDYENPNAKAEYAQRLRASEEKLTALLERLEYDFELNKNPDANFSPDPTDKRNYLVVIGDPVQKEKFKEQMKQEGFEFFITRIDYEDKQAYVEEMYRRLLEKARLRAELLARLSNGELGDIVEISESKSEFGLISSFIENFAYSRSYGATTTSFRFNAGVYERSILVKFSLK